MFPKKNLGIYRPFKGDIRLNMAYIYIYICIYIYIYICIYIYIYIYISMPGLGTRVEGFPRVWVRIFGVPIIWVIVHWVLLLGSLSLGEPTYGGSRDIWEVLCRDTVGLFRQEGVAPGFQDDRQHMGGYQNQGSPLGVKMKGGVLYLI